MLGFIYGRGLGVNADIPKAGDYLRKAEVKKRQKKELPIIKKIYFGNGKVQ